MKRVLSVLVTLILALWAGSLVHTVITVSTLFKVFPKVQSAVALEAAPVVFAVTERYHMGLALISLAAIPAWRLLGGCNRSRRWMMGFAVLAAILAFVQSLVISAKMNDLREHGLSGGPEFNKLHHYSTTEYVVQTVLVLAALAMLPTAVTSPCDQCAPGTAPRSPAA